MYLKKLKLQNKKLLFQKIFISVCTVIYLTVPSSIYKAEGSGTFNIRAVDTYYYGVLTYNLENTPPNYIKLGTGTSPVASPTTPNYYYHYKFAFNNFGCYNGRLQLSFSRGSLGVNDSIIVEGAVLYSSSNDTSGYYITIEFNGDKYATMDIYIKLATNSLVYSGCSALGTWTEHGNSVAENVENAYNQLVSLNSSISTINTYTYQINDKLALSNNHLFTIASNTTTLVTNTNNIKNNTDNIKDKLDTLHTDNQDIITAINNINITSQTDTDKITNFNTEYNLITNIENDLKSDLDITVASDLDLNASEYLERELLNQQYSLDIPKKVLEVINNIGWGGITATNTSITGIFPKMLRVVFIFVLIGVIIG